MVDIWYIWLISIWVPSSPIWAFAPNHRWSGNRHGWKHGRCSLAAGNGHPRLVHCGDDAYSYCIAITTITIYIILLLYHVILYYIYMVTIVLLLCCYYYYSYYTLLLLLLVLPLPLLSLLSVLSNKTMEQALLIKVVIHQHLETSLRLGACVRGVVTTPAAPAAASDAWELPSS